MRAVYIRRSMSYAKKHHNKKALKKRHLWRFLIDIIFQRNKPALVASPLTAPVVLIKKTDHTEENPQRA